MAGREVVVVVVVVVVVRIVVLAAVSVLASDWTDDSPAYE